MEEDVMEQLPEPEDINYHEMARAAGYSEEQILEWFGPEQMELNLEPAEEDKPEFEDVPF